jgi:hypothetical protein
MSDHELYDVLCAIAATGQLGVDERADFDEHCLHCQACRDQLRELTSIGMQLQLDSAIHTTEASLPEGALERFRSRAIREGIAPRSAPERPSYALASASVVFVLISALIFTHGRKNAERFTVSNVPPVIARQGLSEPVTGATRLGRSQEPARTHWRRREPVARTYTGIHDASATAPRFLRAISVSYPFFGSQSVTRPTSLDYPALSRSQMSRLNLFRSLDPSQSRIRAGIATPDRPIDIASNGAVFGFAVNIRQLHFQLPTAQ